MYMKKIIILIVALLTIGMTADAQVRVKKKNTPETIYMTDSFNRITRMDGDYFLSLWWGDSETYDICIGQNKEEAIDSMNSFLEIAMTIKAGDAYELESLDRSFTIYKGFSEKDIRFVTVSRQYGYANAFLSAKEIHEILLGISLLR